jgi:dienelactone hydrolase
MKTQDIEYRADGVRLVGYLAVDETRPGKRPGVIVAHEGGGLGEHAKERARRLAALGYVAFASDMFGDGRELTGRDEMMKTIGGLMGDLPKLRGRIRAALEVIRAQPQVEPAKIAGIGYCFGGTTVLELARSGAAVAGVVGFHSGLRTSAPQDARNIKGKVLVQLGADDPLIPVEQRTQFEEEMRKGGVDWRIILYGGTKHSFTNPDAGRLGWDALEYNKSADDRSWRAMLDFFTELFGPV